MPKLTVNGKTVDVEKGKRLVRAIEEAGIKIGHRCGGNARCTTCRVQFESGEPSKMTQAEKERLTSANLLGEARLACQILVEQDMSVKPLMTAENQPQWNGDNGPTPKEEITPEPEWID